MKIKQNLLLLFPTLLFMQCNVKDDTAYKSALDYKWTSDPVHVYQRSSIDSTIIPHAMFLETIWDEKGIIGTLVPIQKTNSTISVKIKYKTDHCEKLSVMLATIGACERINAIDTIQLHTTEEWAESTHIVKIKNAHLLNISIEAAGTVEKNAEVWISDFEILINGKSIHTQKKGNIHIREKDVINWSKHDYHNLPFMEDRIVALGESAHGTQTMNDLAFSILKERIVKHQCTQVMLEIPLEFSFYINRYIKNDENFKLEEIATYLENSLYSNSLLSFLEWLKEYNLTHDEKVSFWGFDLNFIEFKSKVDLFNFFYTLNKDLHSKDIDTICEYLLDMRSYFGEIISICKNSPNLIRVFHEDELKLMLHCLKVTDKENKRYFRYINRDNAMNEITTFIMDNFLKDDKTATLYGHLGHLNYLSAQDLSILNFFPFGYYMKNKYKDDYSCIAITTNQGSALLTKSTAEFGFGDSELMPAPQESLEYQLNRFKKDSIYLPMRVLDCGDLLKVRHVGNRDIEEQFRYMIPKSRMDGVLFIKKSFSVEKNDTVLSKNLHPNHVISTAYKEALDKMRNK